MNDDRFNYYEEVEGTDISPTAAALLVVGQFLFRIFVAMALVCLACFTAILLAGGFFQ